MHCMVVLLLQTLAGPLALSSTTVHFPRQPFLKRHQWRVSMKVSTSTDKLVTLQREHMHTC